jgi:hypothetical protein
MNIFISISFIIFAIFLLAIETSVDFIQGPSAIFLSSILFLVLGTAPFINFIFQYIKRKVSILTKNPPTIKKEQDIQLGSIKKEIIDDDSRFCKICGEKYPESTIHGNCIMCGSPISSRQD